MSAAAKLKDADCYVSNRVFDGVRVHKDAASVARHTERAKRALAKIQKKDEKVKS